MNKTTRYSLLMILLPLVSVFYRPMVLSIPGGAFSGMAEDQRNLSNLRLIEAARNGDLNEVKNLIQAGVNVNIQDVLGETALMIASRDGYKDIVNELIEKGENNNLDLQDRQGSTALMYAVRRDRGDIVKMLIEKGANPNVQNYRKQSALMYAAAQGNLTIVQELLKKEDLNLDAQGADGRTALIYAAIRPGNKEIVEELIKAGANLDIQEEGAMNALMYALFGNRDTANELIKAGAHVNAQDKKGETALMKTIANPGNKNLVKELLEKGAHINAQDKKGETALMKAAREPYGYLDIVKLLLSYGADFNTRAYNRKKALDFAQDRTHNAQNNPVITLLQNIEAASEALRKDPLATVFDTYSSDAQVNLVEILIKRFIVQNNEVMLKEVKTAYPKILKAVLEDPCFNNKYHEDAFKANLIKPAAQSLYDTIIITQN